MVGFRVGVSGDADSLTGLLLPASTRDGGLLCAGVDSAEARWDELRIEEARDRCFIKSVIAIAGTGGFPAARDVAFIVLTCAWDFVQIVL